MRMWMIDPRLMCRQHLLGEHNEIHKHRHNFVKKHSINGRIESDQIEPSSMGKRHDVLVQEMRSRNYKHNSPYKMPDISYLPLEHQTHVVDVGTSLRQLIARCPECKKKVLDQGVPV